MWKLASTVYPLPASSSAARLFITQFTVLLISSVTIVSMPIARRYQTLRLSSVRSSRIERRSEWMITNISTMMAR